jgi:2-dehydro-3-deoxyphosphooctonate aldolase (KDO 8-P synthase)
MLDYNVLKEKPFVIAGPCSAESEELCLEIASFCKEIVTSAGFTYIFKASFDKANRTSIKSYRGPGLKEGLRILEKIKLSAGVPVCTDIHSLGQAKKLSSKIDIIQIPAFLARQTDLVVEAAKYGNIVNIKKPQFVSYDKMKYIAEKCIESGNSNILLTERGSMFGSNDLVVDYRNVFEMKKYGYPVIIDSTHSCQKMSFGETTSGNREYAPYFAKAGFIFGATGLFAEVHPNPEKGLSDSKNMINFEMFKKLIKELEVVKNENIC